MRVEILQSIVDNNIRYDWIDGNGAAQHVVLGQSWPERWTLQERIVKYASMAKTMCASTFADDEIDIVIKEQEDL